MAENNPAYFIGIIFDIGTEGLSSLVSHTLRTRIYFLCKITADYNRGLNTTTWARNDIVSETRKYRYAYTFLHNNALKLLAMKLLGPVQMVSNPMWLAVTHHKIPTGIVETGSKVLFSKWQES